MPHATQNSRHLDFAVTVKDADKPLQLHGLLGQTYHWTRDTPAVVEGGDDLLYLVDDGILGTKFKFNLFEDSEAAAAAVAEGGAAAAAWAGPVTGASVPRPEQRSQE